MKKWAYWISTVLLAAMYLAGATMYLSNISGIQQVFATMGFPGYLVPILGVAKLLGAITILWRFSVALTDLAYAGMFFHLLLAFSAHIHTGDGGFAPAIAGLVFLGLSFFTQNAARKKPSPYGGRP
ncbi:DoxX family protein [Stenotrophomonas indicatrix]